MSGVISVNSFDTSFSIKLDTVSSTLLYVGEGALNSISSEPVWRIRKIETIGTVMSVLWADGNQRFDNVWDNRTSLSYS
jgi:hypothetical protein